MRPASQPGVWKYKNFDSLVFCVVSRSPRSIIAVLKFLRKPCAAATFSALVLYSIGCKKLTTKILCSLLVFFYGTGRRRSKSLSTAPVVSQPPSILQGFCKTFRFCAAWEPNTTDPATNARESVMITAKSCLRWRGWILDFTQIHMFSEKTH